jgi:hypothetical protein
MISRRTPRIYRPNGVCDAKFYSARVRLVLLRWLGLPAEVLLHISEYLDCTAIVMLAHAYGLSDVGPMFVDVAAASGHVGILNKYGCWYPMSVVKGAAFTSQCKIVIQWMRGLNRLQRMDLLHFATRYSNHATWCEVMYAVKPAEPMHHIIHRIAERKGFEFGVIGVTRPLVVKMLTIACKRGSEWIQRAYDWINTQRIYEYIETDDIVCELDNVELYICAEQYYNRVINGVMNVGLAEYRLQEWGPNIRAWLNA